MEETKLCLRCKLPMPDHGPAIFAGCERAMEKAMTALLKNVGQLGTCRGCNAPVVWVRHANNRPTPYTTEGLNHFVNCPERADFKKANK